MCHHSGPEKYKTDKANKQSIPDAISAVQVVDGLHVTDNDYDLGSKTVSQYKNREGERPNMHQVAWKYVMQEGCRCWTKLAS